MFCGPLAPPFHMKFTWFEVAPGLASPETLHLYQGTGDRLVLQLLLHVGSRWSLEHLEDGLVVIILATPAPVTEAST